MSSSIRLASSAFVVLATTLSSSVINATQCDEFFQEPQDSDYYELNKPPIDESTSRQLREFAQQIDGKWRGTGFEVKCGISDGKPLSTIINFEADADISQHFQGAIILRAEKESTRKVHLEKIGISPNIDKQRQDRRKGLYSYTVSFDNPNTMIFEEKFRVFTKAPPTGRTAGAPSFPYPNNDAELSFFGLFHEIKSVKLVNDTLEINRDIYVNGRFATNQEWQLTRIN